MRQTHSLAPHLTKFIVVTAIVAPSFGYLVAITSAKLGDTIQRATQRGTVVEISSLLWVFAGVLLGSTLFSMANSSLQKIWRNTIRVRDTARIVALRYSLDIGRIKSAKFEELVIRIMESPHSWGVAMQLTTMQFNIAGLLIATATSTVILSKFSPYLAITLFVLLLPEFFSSIYIGKVEWKIRNERAEKARKRDEASQCFKMYAKITEVKLFAMGPFLKGLIEAYDKKLLGDIKWLELKKLMVGGLSELLAVGGVVYCIYQVANAAVHGNILIGTMTLLIYGINNMRSSCNQLLSEFAEQYSQAAYLSDLLEFHSLKPLLPAPENPVTLRLNQPPLIEFQEVWFKYPEQESNWALQDVSFVIRPGDKISVFGGNGSGKSTVLNLLSRIYHPTRGKVLINGIDLATIDPASWFDHLSILLQNHGAYNFTIREVVGLGDLGTTSTDEGIWEALRYAMADKVVEGLPQGLDTQLGTHMGGVDLSGGQRKRIAIAMRMLRMRHLMMFDEPENQLDSASRALFFDQLRQLSRATTAIYVSHNLTTLQLAQRIMIFEEGKLVGEGSHEELLRDPHCPYTIAYEKEMAALRGQITLLAGVDPARTGTGS